MPVTVASREVHEKAIESIRRKIDAMRSEISDYESLASRLSNKDVRKLDLNKLVKERESKICGCKDAMRAEEKQMTSIYPPGIIGRLTDFGYCFPSRKLDIRPVENPNWSNFDRWLIENYYLPVIDSLQEGAEREGGLYIVETEKKILDRYLPAAWLWTYNTFNRLSNLGSMVSMPFMPEPLMFQRQNIPKRLTLKKGNKNMSRPYKPSYDIPLIKALQMRFNWSEFANSENLDPNNAIMSRVSLYRIHHPELVGLRESPRDLEAAHIVEDSVRKWATVELEQQNMQGYQNPYPKNIIKGDRPLTYKVRLPDSRIIVVDSPNIRAKTSITLENGRRFTDVTYNDALNLIDEAWKAELERKKITKERYMS